MGGFPIFRWSRADGTGLVSSGMFGSRQTAGRELDMFTVYREEEGEGEEACEGGKRARQVRDGAYRWHQGDIDLRMHNHRFWSHRLPARFRLFRGIADCSIDHGSADYQSSRCGLHARGHGDRSRGGKRFGMASSLGEGQRREEQYVAFETIMAGVEGVDDQLSTLQ